MRFAHRLRQDQPVRFTIEVENFGVASPVHRRFELPLDLVLAEMLVEDVVEKLFGDGMIVLGVQNAVDLLQDHDMPECGLPEQNLAGFREVSALGGNFHIALFQGSKAEQDGSLDDREKIFGIHDEIFGKAVEVFFTAAVLQEFE